MQNTTIKQSVNKELLYKRFSSAAKTYDTHAIVQKHMAEVLVNMAQKHIPENQTNMMELGCGTGLLTNQITRKYTAEHYWANDLVGEMEPNIKQIVESNSNAGLAFLQGDAQTVSPPATQDVFWSGATIQWIEDLDSFFARISTLLNAQGYFALSSFDVDNFMEIKTITGKGIDYKSIKDVLVSASTHFKILDYKSWHQKMWFNHPTDVLKHMRYTGVNAVSSTKWGKKDLLDFCNDYKMFCSNNKYPLTYNPFVLILQKK